MDFRVLKYFETVAKFNNITKASEELKIAQPSISQQITALERDMGVKLFERIKSGVILTLEGELLLQRVGPILKQYEELLNYMSGDQEKGFSDLTVAAFPGISEKLSKSLSELWSTNPNIHITVREGQSRFILSLVRSREAQIGVCRLPILFPELNYNILGNDPIQVVLRKDDPLTAKERIVPEDLRERPILLIRNSNETSSFTQILQVIEEHGVKTKIIGHMETVASLLHMIKQGPGIGLIPRSTVSLSPTGLKAVPFGESDIYIPTAVVWLKNESNPMVFKLKSLIIKYCSFK